MYRHLLICLDNSDHSNSAAKLAVSIASKNGAQLTGLHVYAARLHNARFLEMEDGLPPEYQGEDKIKSTREVHDSLITRGLRIISDSYTAVFQALAKSSGLDAAGVSREGKNFEEIVAESNEACYDLVLLGKLGLGATNTSRIGSVAERVVRRVRKDVIIAGDNQEDSGPILVAIDGSAFSFGGLTAALELSRLFNRPIEAVAAFDPVFHQAAFRSIAGVLTEEAGRLFRFTEQERLHDEIIDKGLARIYRGHLDTAERIASSLGSSIKTTLLSGKASDEIIKYARAARPFMAVFGRTGAHATDGLDIGSTAENCLRELGCHILVSSRELVPQPEKSVDSVEWAAEAEEVLDRIPQFARGIVRNMVEDAARKGRVKHISAAFMREVRKKMDGN